MRADATVDPLAEFLRQQRRRVPTVLLEPLVRVVVVQSRSRISPVVQSRSISYAQSKALRVAYIYVCVCVWFMCGQTLAVRGAFETVRRRVKAAAAHNLWGVSGPITCHS